MTTGTGRIDEILHDARELQADALELLAQGKVRNAAEKGWEATFRAMVALVLASTGVPDAGLGTTTADKPETRDRLWLQTIQDLCFLGWTIRST